MNTRPWRRYFEHPYQNNAKAAETHGHLKPTWVSVPEYTTFAVPFRWMLAQEQGRIDGQLAESLPPDSSAPFPTPWVFGRERQEAIVEHVFGQLEPGRSLVFFYCKDGHPLGDTISRLLVGVGLVTSVAPTLHYDTGASTTYPMWDRMIGHSIRDASDRGFLVPYHDLLEQLGDTGDPDAAATELRDVAIAADASHTLDFSYAGELISPDVALTTLAACMTSVRAVVSSGRVKGPWAKREKWLNDQMAAAWNDRGAFPGFGASLEALGLRLGTALQFDLLRSGTLATDDDPWPLLDALYNARQVPPHSSYAPDLAAGRPVWNGLSAERRELLMLLSRMDLSPAQAKRWFDPARRAHASRFEASDRDILDNAYRIAELDLGDRDDLPLPLSVVDRALLPDPTIAAQHPLSSPTVMTSTVDLRRVRAALIGVLRAAAEDGDTLLSSAEALARLGQIRLDQPCEIGPDWLNGHRALLQNEILFIDIGADGTPSWALQLAEHYSTESKLRHTLLKRAAKALPALDVEWPTLLIAAIGRGGTNFNASNPRHVDALNEQVTALRLLTTRKLAVLVGRAGTGKTSVMGALANCEKLSLDGVLFLAPTGKARVRLSKTTGKTAKTVAQFLNSLDRYDGEHQRSLLVGKKKLAGPRTVVVDECSMLTSDDLLAVLEALDLGHVQRLLLVGDPNQLPPIGPGRPFADLVGFIEALQPSDDGTPAPLKGALARLDVEVRTAAGAPSDALRLAAWFARGEVGPESERVLSQLQTSGAFSDLDVTYWQTPEELHELVLDQLRVQLGVEGPSDLIGFNRAIGLDERGWVPFENPDGVERFQLLSPVRMNPYGVNDLNRWFQALFRQDELGWARRGRATSLGDQEIVVRDKVMQTRNEGRKAWNNPGTVKVDLANGEIGLMANGQRPWLNGVFAGRPNLTIGYQPRDFPGGGGPLELAYALTVHKAQGSEFGIVFVVLPSRSRLVSRELLYTALTRSRTKLVLMIQGTDPGVLYEISQLDRSATARRNTNLFAPSVRPTFESVPYAEHLIHRTASGHLVRSKSELVIANMLTSMDLAYRYEQPVTGTVRPGVLRPDFSFVDGAGDLLLWEHLGMLTRPDYRSGWEWKKSWYEANGYVLGENLLTTEDDDLGGLDSGTVREVAERIRDML